MVGFATPPLFQASALDPEGPVEMTVDVGSTRKLSAVHIEWEFPAKAYALSVSVDGVKWSEVHSTDSNVLQSNRIALGSVPASKVKLIMHQALRMLRTACSGALEAASLQSNRFHAGCRQLPRTCIVWHSKVFRSSAPSAEHCRGLRGCSQEQ